MQTLLAPPRQHLNPAEVAAALAYASGGTFRRGVDVLDLNDKPTGETLPFTTGQVEYSYRPHDLTGQTSGVTETRRRFTCTLAGPVVANLSARRLRPWTEVRTASGWARFHHGVFEPQNPGVADDGAVVTRNLNCVDKSARWAAKQLGAPTVVSGSTAVVGYIKNSLTNVFGEQSFAIASSDATLGQQRVFEARTSYLEFYSRLLEGIGYDQLSADEAGRPASQPLSVLAGKGAEATYGAGEGKILTAGTVSPLLPTLPNVLVFSARQGPSLGNIDGNGLTTRKNQSTGPASIDARGGHEVVEYIDVDVDSQSALVAYADAEKQRYFAGGGLRFEGHVALNPLAGDRDVVAIRLPRLALRGDLWLVTGWTLPMQDVNSEGAVLMRITAERRVT